MTTRGSTPRAKWCARARSVCPSWLAHRHVRAHTDQVQPHAGAALRAVRAGGLAHHGHYLPSRHLLQVLPAPRSLCVPCRVACRASRLTHSALLLRACTGMRCPCSCRAHGLWHHRVCDPGRRPRLRHAGPVHRLPLHLHTPRHRPLRPHHRVPQPRLRRRPAHRALGTVHGAVRGDAGARRAGALLPPSRPPVP